MSVEVVREFKASVKQRLHTRALAFVREWDNAGIPMGDIRRNFTLTPLEYFAYDENPPEKLLGAHVYKPYEKMSDYVLAAQINKLTESIPMPKVKPNNAEASAQILPDSEYIKADISDEAWREVVLASGMTIRIDNPVTLIFRKGGSTHRVVDDKGEVYCYAAPETGQSILKWKSKNEDQPVQF